MEKNVLYLIKTNQGTIQVYPFFYKFKTLGPEATQQLYALTDLPKFPENNNQLVEISSTTSPDLVNQITSICGAPQFISRLVVAIGNGELNKITDEDKKTLLSITSGSFHTRKISLLTQIKGSFQPFADMKKDLVDTFKPYRSDWYAERDAKQPLAGLFNFFKGIGYILGSLLLFVALPIYSIPQKNRPEDVGYFFALGERYVFALSWFIDGVLSVIRGATQLVEDKEAIRCIEEHYPVLENRVREKYTKAIKGGEVTHLDCGTPTKLTESGDTEPFAYLKLLGWTPYVRDSKPADPIVETTLGKGI